METRLSMIKIDLRNKNAVAVWGKADHVLNKLKDNPHFPIPQPHIEEVKVLADALGEILTKKKAIPVETRKRAQQKLCKALSKLAMWVFVVSKGNADIILTTGFDVRKRRSTASLRPAPQLKRSLKLAKAGCIKLMWRADVLTLVYNVYLSDDDNPEQRKKVASSTKSSAIISGLESGKRYRLQVSCINSAGEGPLSNAIVVCEGWA
jgi:hypothetical protein